MGFSDGRFYQDVLRGHVYRYWWEGLARSVPSVWPSGLVWPPSWLNLRG
ncbi:MAG TPA: hypothetical protein PLM25_06625 [Limnochordia bacterium]|nr:hypothetical protein [Limnochordia bacterium]